MSENDDIFETQSQAAERIGVSHVAVNTWIKKQKIPHEIVAKKKMIRSSVVDAVILAIEAHGRDWAKKAPWNQDGEEIELEEDLVEESPEEDIDVDWDMIADSVSLARKYREAGNHQMACELFATAADFIDWDELRAH